MMSRVSLLFGCGLLLACAGGCGERGVALYDCTGTVTLDGKPVDGAMVCFVNTSMAAPSTGTTDAGGAFTFKSPVGDFSVSIVKLEGGASKENPYAPSKHLLPEKYAQAKTSGFQAVVATDKTKNTYSFDLKK
ncbi:MAG: carboxypeptidase-like regulatory domain-containing protein [Thermoguttaceae bacterium]